MKHKDFIMKANLAFFILLVTLPFIQCNVTPVQTSSVIQLPEPLRQEGQTDVLQLTSDPIPIIRIGFIGLGMRGKGAVTRMMSLKDVEVVAICDLEQSNLDLVQKNIEATRSTRAIEYTGENGWKELCERDDIDLIYICTDWYSHARMAVYAMEQGKHVATEIPGGLTIDECWQLVNTAELTRKHCMMLENCCYDKFELAALNMAQQGVLGEIVHVEGAYLHDIRQLLTNPRTDQNHRYEPGVGLVEQEEKGIIGYRDQWRNQFNIDHTGNPYPTHAIGPICQILNIHRGDKMNMLVSVSSNQFGITEYVTERFGIDSPEAKQEYKMGDVNTSIIKTEKGKTIVVQHSASTPRPYSRTYQLVGTRGFIQKYPVNQMLIESLGKRSLTGNAIDSILMEYQHDFYKIAGEQAEELKMIAHGGMDYIMDYRLIYCLKNGLPLDQDVYDAAEWSCIIELSEISAKNNGMPVKIPDFTRGSWNKLNGLKFAM